MRSRVQIRPLGRSLTRRQLAARNKAAPTQQQPVAAGHLAVQMVHQMEQGMGIAMLPGKRAYIVISFY